MCVVTKQNDPADSALRLLRSLATSTQSPDHFEQACLDWESFGGDANALPEFKAIMTSMRDPVAASPDTIANPPPESEDASQLPIDQGDLFFLNEDGEISEINPELSNALNLHIGDPLRGLDLELLRTEGEPHNAQILSLPDAVQIMRKIIVHRLSDPTSRHSFSAQFVRARFTPGFRDHLQAEYELTNSELDILQLCLRRYRLEQIAGYRNNSLNTVRTHISRILKKLSCNSVTEALACAVELSLAYNADVSMPPDVATWEPRRTFSLTLPNTGQQIEYSRYGPASGRPLVVLHSTEYGFAPPLDFINAARARNICLYFPLRPGYGNSTVTHSLQESADLLLEFMKLLELKRATVIALSMAAPVALHMQSEKQIEKLILVNYGLNASSKIDAINPAWIRGLVRMSIDSQTAFSFVGNAFNVILKTFGAARFYRMLYSSIDSDLAFSERHPDLFEQFRTYMMKADDQTIRLDLTSSFTYLNGLETLLAGQKSVLVANGALQHAVDPEEAIMNADALGVSFKLVPNGGRNWMFDDPAYFFDYILDR